MLSYGHDSLPVFGVGSELNEGEWRGVVRQLLASGLLAVKSDHGTLALTDLSAEVLRGEREVLFRRDAPRPASPAARGGRGPKAGAGGAASPGVRPGVRRLVLRPSFPRGRGGVRAAARLAGGGREGTGHAGVRDLPRRDPAADRGVAAVDASGACRFNGVGETKLARYGQQILEVLAETAP